MGLREKIKFHSDRAMAELDLALAAGSVTAARAHFDLSSLHLQEMRNLVGPVASSTVRAH